MMIKQEIGLHFGLKWEMEAEEYEFPGLETKYSEITFSAPIPGGQFDVVTTSDDDDWCLYESFGQNPFHHTYEVEVFDNPLAAMMFAAKRERRREEQFEQEKSKFLEWMKAMPSESTSDYA